MRVLSLIGLMALLTGCAEKAAENQPAASGPKPPKITHFYGNQSVVPKGSSLTLCYGTENVEKLTLKPHEDGDLRPSFNRCVADMPVKDTTYTLTANGPGGETTASFTVRVGPPAPPAPPAGAPQRTLIQSFNVLGANPIKAGDHVQICYTAEHAASVSMQPAVGKGKLSPGKNVCTAVSPQKTTDYILTATAADGAVDRMQVTVTVQ